jgi:hypothetical protein
MSNPTHPIITFRVNLQTVNNNSHLTPDRYDSDQDRAQTNQANHSETRSTWIPGINLDNRALKHGDEFIAYGQQATYLKNTYTTGANPTLTIVSESFASA